MDAIQFGAFHNIADLRMFLTSYSIGPATPKIRTIDLPGGNGSIDATEALGRVLYNDRQCEFVLTQDPADQIPWESRKSIVCGKINGIRCNLVLSSDHDYYYDTRISVDGEEIEGSTHRLKLSGIAKPWKLKSEETVVTVSGNKTVELVNGTKPAIPWINASTPVTIMREDGPDVVVGMFGVNGTNINDLEIKPGGTRWTIQALDSSKIPTVTIRYREGEF